MTTLFRTPPRTSLPAPCRRALSTTPQRAVSLQWDKNDPEALAGTVPPYPYGPPRWYKQSRLGLYGGQRIQFGNNIGEEFGVKTRRSWHPNVLTRKLFSKSLNRPVQVRVTTRVLRTIDKLGGLDEYLLGEKERRIRELGESGWWLRWAIMQTPAIRKRFADERARLGVPAITAPDAETDAAEEEAAAVIEEVSSAEAAAAAETGEALATDDTFTIEQSAEAPALKFRVGPGKHLILTAAGWRRTRPTTQHAVETKLQQLASKYEDELLPKREAYFQEQLAAQEEPLTTSEQQQILTEARRTWRKECRGMAEAEWAAHVAKRESRKAERRARQNSTPTGSNSGGSGEGNGVDGEAKAIPSV